MKRGFTLIEVLVTLGILGVAMFLLLDAHFSALRMQSDTMDEVELRSLVELAVAEAELGVLTNTLTDEGDFGERYKKYRYSYEAELQGTENVPLYRVRVVVSHEERGDTEMEFFVFNPS